MKKNTNLPPEFTSNENTDPLYYKIEHEMAVHIWKVLFAAGNEKTARMLSATMIDQGCQGVIDDDLLLIFMFWKDFLTDRNVITVIPDDKELH